MTEETEQYLRDTIARLKRDLRAEQERRAALEADAESGRKAVKREQEQRRRAEQAETRAAEQVSDQSKLHDALAEADHLRKRLDEVETYYRRLYGSH